MTMEQVPQLVPRVTPEVALENNDKVAEKIAKQFEKEIETIIDQGLATLTKGKPSERLEAYLTNTLEQDRDLVLDPDYFEKRMQGLPGGQRLLSEVMLQEYEQAEQAQAQIVMQAQEAGVPYQPSPQDLPAKPPMLWPLLLRVLPLKGTAFKKVAADFRKVSHDAAKRYDFTGIMDEPQAPPGFHVMPDGSVMPDAEMQ